MTADRPTLGVIADDFTGATDVASMLVRAGMRTVQVIGVPEGALPAVADAVVVALKSRTVPAADAIRESLAALAWLREAGARQFYFKYCSTFDSTPAGNIGPVAEALLAALDSDFTIACPAFPENGRMVFRGHLFVGDALLSDTGMRQHPLTPMSDSNLVRVLQAQATGKVGLLRHDTLARGEAATREAIAALRAQGVRLAVADAIDNEQLRVLAAATADLPLLTAGSGLALGLPAVYAARGWIRPDAEAATLDAVGGLAAVLSGSCSTATRAQVAQWREAGRSARSIDARDLAAGRPVVADALRWACDEFARLEGGPVLVHATAEPAVVQAVQAELGAAHAGELVEHALAAIAQGLVESGVRRLVVAGGETSGAVVSALGVRQLRIGAAIAPGVPWTQAEGRPLKLALKSGNFGGPDFFHQAIEQAK
jgi:3-dehydrotetronate 4-kinase